MIAQIANLGWTIGAFVLALSIIVTVHEYGHYIIGRLSGIKAEVFSLGFGPRLIARRDRHGTLWQIAAIPLGGYVRFLGDANAASTGSVAVDPARVRQTLTGAPLWARFATVAAGPVFNFILSILVFAGMAIWQGMPTDAPQVGRLHDTPPGVEIGLQPGDQIRALQGQPVADWAALGRIAADLPKAASYDWTVQRDGTEITVPGPSPLPALITGVAPRSAAATAGLKAGDVVLAVDGRPVARFDDLRDLVAGAEGRPVLLRVWRAGQGEADYTLLARQQDLPTATGYERRWMIGVTGGGAYFDPATRATGLGRRWGSASVAPGTSSPRRFRGSGPWSAARSAAAIWAARSASRKAPAKRRRRGRRFHLVDRGAVCGNRVSEPLAGAGAGWRPSDVLRL